MITPIVKIKKQTSRSGFKAHTPSQSLYRLIIRTKSKQFGK